MTNFSKKMLENAHRAARREIQLAEYGENKKLDYRVTFAAALKNEIIAANLRELDGLAAWEKMSDSEKYDACKKMVFWLKRHDGCIFRESINNYLAPVLDWTRGADDLLAVAHETFIRLIDYLANGKAGTLGGLLFKAAYTAAQAIKRAERRNANALRVTEDDNGEKLAYIIDNAAPLAEPIAPSPENALLINESIAAAALDKVDRAIIAGLAAGYKGKEIAAAIGITPAAISKRIKAIRERYNND